MSTGSLPRGGASDEFTSMPYLAVRKAKGLSPLKRLLALYRPDRSDIWAVVIFSVISGTLLLATPVAVQALVNFVAFGASVPSLVILAALLFMGLSAGAMVKAIQTWIVELLQRRVFVRLVADLGERLPRLSWNLRDKYYGPELVNRFFDIVIIQKMTAVLLLDGMANLLSIAVGLSVLAFYHPLLLAFDIGLIMAIVLLLWFPHRKGTRTAINESAAKYEVASWLEEIARHPATFKVAGSENYARFRSEEVTRGYIESRRIHYRVVFGQILGALGLQVLANTALLGLGGWLVVNGELSLGQLVAAELLVVLVVQSVAKVGTLAEKYYDIVAAVDKVGKLIDLDLEAGVGNETITGTEKMGTPAEVVSQGLVLKPHVGGAVETPLNFHLNPGEILGVTGPHGAGKTHLIEMLYRLREPTGGSLMFDGSHYSDIALSSFRSQVALASDPEVLEDSLFNNVAVGRLSVGLPEVEQALKDVGLWQTIRHLTDGLQTRLRPSGAPLSSGQRSRLILARALASSPRLMLIDGLLDDLSASDKSVIANCITNRTATTSFVVVTDNPEIQAMCSRTIELGTNLPEEEGGAN